MTLTVFKYLPPNTWLVPAAEFLHLSFSSISCLVSAIRLSVSWGSAGFTRLERYAVDIDAALPTSKSQCPVNKFTEKHNGLTVAIVPPHRFQEGALSILDCLAATELAALTNQLIVEKVTSCWNSLDHKKAWH